MRVTINFEYDDATMIEMMHIALDHNAISMTSIINNQVEMVLNVVENTNELISKLYIAKDEYAIEFKG